MKKENVIIITLDKLAFRFIDIKNDQLGICPTLKKLSNEGVFFTNFFSHGCPTMIALPALFSSTLPLSYGGYDDGIRHRPCSLMGAVKEAGYKTSVFSAQSAFDQYCYDNGVDEYYSLFDINCLWSQLSFYLKYFVNRNKNNKVLDSQCSDIYKAIDKFYQEILDFCSGKLVENLNVPKKRKPYRYDFKKIHELITEEKKSLNKQKSKYIETNLNAILGSGLESFLGIKKMSIFDLFPARFLKNHKNTNSFFKLQFWERYLTAPRMMKALLGWIDQNKSKPFVTAVHICDISGNTFREGPLQYNFNRRIFNKNKKFYGENIGSYFYHLAINYVDSAIASFIKELEKRNLLENTHIFITSDHGGNPDAENSPFNGPALPGGGFKDDYQHIPLIYWSQGNKLKTANPDNLYGHIDIAPSICDLLKITKPEQFVGRSFFATNDPGHQELILEHTHRGPCDLPQKPIYICLRSKKYKYIWKEAHYREDFTGKCLEEFYDLHANPEETINLISEEKLSEIISEFRLRAKKRYNEIRENA